MNDNQNINQNELTSGEKKGKHRFKYSGLLNNAKPSDIKNIDCLKILYFICYLQNWGTYKSYEPSDFYNWFLENRPDFIERLNGFLEDDKNKQNVYIAFYQVLKLVNSADGYQKKYYYTEFIDDLEMLLGFTVKGTYYNFFTPSIYDKEAEQEAALILYDLERAREDKNYKSKLFKLEA